MLSFHWPGNVRQLKATVRRAVLLADELIEESHLELETQSPNRSPADERSRNYNWEGRSLREIIQEKTTALERQVISQTLNYTKGNKAKAARLLQVDYKTLHTKVKQFGI
ncbi:MAG: hypothetical protein MJE63_05350 [Proteobacteria bacterium]|nr:hypothetical protein [Pseudomonadota bacterium]